MPKLSLLLLLLVSCETYAPVTSRPEEFDPSEHGYTKINDDYIGGNGAPLLIANFYKHVFADMPNRPPVVVYSRWDQPLPYFKGVYVYLDGEPDGLIDEHKQFVDQMLYIGPRSDTGAKSSIYLPFVSMSYAERQANPLDLLKVPVKTKKTYFAAYMASNCVPFREQYYDELVELARVHNLGPVHALSKCHGRHPETRKKVETAKGRNNQHFMDTAPELLKDYKFVLTMENVVVPGYITEKPVNAMLAGSIPVYLGSRNIVDIFNSDSLIYVRPGESLADTLLPVARSEAKYFLLSEVAPIAVPDQMYLFSWHKTVATYFKSRGKKTLQDKIAEKLRNEL